jgi:hypothetical protein
LLWSRAILPGTSSIDWLCSLGGPEAGIDLESLEQAGPGGALPAAIRISALTSYFLLKYCPKRFGKMRRVPVRESFV